MSAQLKPLPGQTIKKCPYCSDNATKQIRVGIGRIGFYFPCCPSSLCIVKAKNDANSRLLAHRASARQATIASFEQSEAPIRHRLISKLGITLGWNGKSSNARG
jgi:hypothetical protein